MPRRILVVRRDNIGDLILTTPLIRALRQAMPDAYIAALVTSYNAPVLAGNPDLNAVHFYTKGKHADSWFGMIGARYAQFRLFLKLRGEAFDDIVLAELSYLPRNIRLAKFIKSSRKAARIIGFEHDNGTCAGLDVVVSKVNSQDLQMAQYAFRLAQPYGVDTAPEKTPPCIVYPANSAQKLTKNLQIGLHVSARKPLQRWSAAAFVQLAKLIHLGDSKVSLTIFWSPGKEDDPLHPGDDSKSDAIISALKAESIPINAVPTASLRDLINNMANVDVVICADGGALHVAAGLNKQIVALFGDSEVKRWHPWKVNYRALQKPSFDVAAIKPEEVYAALNDLMKTSSLTASSDLSQIDNVST
jgi:heptosyltransferase III